MWRKWLISLLALSLITFGWGQSIRIGAVLSTTTTKGRTQVNVLRLIQGQLRATQGIFGVPIEIIITNDNGDPLSAKREVQRLVEQEQVQAIICCNNLATATAISNEGLALKVLTLSLNPLALDSAAPYWLFSLPASDAVRIRRMVLDIASRGADKLALMTLDNSYGDAAKAALEQSLGPGSGLSLVAETRYRPDVRVLTPEALWIATRQPAGVLVWGLAKDSELAVTALKERGYRGAIYLNAGLEPGLPRLSNGKFEGVRIVSDAVAVFDSLDAKNPNWAEANNYLQNMAAVYGPGNASSSGAYVWDAFVLLRAAIEQTLSLGLDPNETAVFRQAMRDSLVGLRPVAGAAAVYDYSEADHQGVDVRSLLIATIREGRLLAVP